eukprot:gnl/TRDRNA2_/TRDRNA2_85555_c0_seq1.p1 gnl/TRDRNA2_/TRDRNA2_85555_c0~~gnl/TRDRNA2_/TRDRNA2_85555_c0_seq1.p1  ORF type:complete len:1245 (+),score=270.97 gnl/TRDRNA2_/TRDRNA2_85555_c0_seq1:46-3780(+)
MVQPWKGAREDPTNLPALEVTFTAWIEALCHPDVLPKASCSFRWLGSNGELSSDAVETGPFTGWEEVPRPPEEPSNWWATGKELEKVAADAPTGDEAADAQAASRPTRPICVRFQKASPPLKVTCALARKLADLALQVKAAVPAAAAAAGTGESEANDAEVSEASSEVKVQLAPLLLPGRDGAGPEVETNGLECLVASGAKTGQGGVEDFKVGVSVSCSSGSVADGVLSLDIATFLNPLLLSLHGVFRLPNDEKQGQTRDRVSTALNLFGARRKTEACTLNDMGDMKLSYHTVFFVGSWNQHELREYLQTQRLVIEVRDRDVLKKPPSVEPKTPTPQPADPAPDPKAKAKAKPLAKEKSAANVDDEPRPPSREKDTSEEVGGAGANAEAEACAYPHGVARFSLEELLNPRLPRTLTLTANVEPVVRDKKHRKGEGSEGEGGRLRVAALFGEQARELLAAVSQTPREVCPNYARAGSFAALDVRIAKPIPLERTSSPDPLPTKPKTKPKAKPKAPTEPEPVDDRYERYSRVVLVVDNRQSTIVRRLLGVVAKNNTEAMGLLGAQVQALGSMELTEAQRADPELDILTGFVVMDRSARVICVEGLRDGAMKQVVEEVGVGTHKNSRRCKVLYHSEVGFSTRAYVDFNLCLKQIKLRQEKLEVLMHRSDLYDRSKSEKEVADTLQGLMEMKRAERLHVLKSLECFPTAAGLVVIETQYGDFVSNEELEGGHCHTDGETVRSKEQDAASEKTAKTMQTGAREGASKSTAAHQSTHATATMDGRYASKVTQATEMLSQMQTDSTAEQQSAADRLDDHNVKYEESLKRRSLMPQPDYINDNKRATIMMSEENHALRELTMKKVDKSFLDEDAPVFCYSSQKLNCTEMQKKHMREKMAQQSCRNSLFTYPSEFNSGCFPLNDEEIAIDKMMRAADPNWKDPKNRPKWRYPKTREPEEFKRLDRDVSLARKEELASAWVENEFIQVSTLKNERIAGAFDSKSLGIGSFNAPGLRPSLWETPLVEPELPPENPEPVAWARAPPTICSDKPMKFNMKPPLDSGTNCGSIVDKYHRGIMDGEPKKFGNRFDKRKVPPELTEKYGKFPPAHKVEVPPMSFNLDEAFTEERTSYKYPSQLAANCSKPVMPLLSFAGAHDILSHDYSSSGSPRGKQTTKLTATQRHQAHRNSLLPPPPPQDSASSATTAHGNLTMRGNLTARKPQDMSTTFSTTARGNLTQRKPQAVAPAPRQPLSAR